MTRLTGIDECLIAFQPRCTSTAATTVNNIKRAAAAVVIPKIANHVLVLLRFGRSPSAAFVPRYAKTARTTGVPPPTVIAIVLSGAVVRQIAPNR